MMQKKQNFCLNASRKKKNFSINIYLAHISTKKKEKNEIIN